MCESWEKLTAHRKTASHKVTTPFPTRFRRPDGTSNPRDPRGLQVPHKFSDERTKETKPYLLKSKHDALSSFQVLVRSVVIQLSFRVERLRVDKEG